jgi:hypothetical protein
MFIELMPLIEKRAITITVAALREARIRVNVWQRMMKHTSAVLARFRQVARNPHGGCESAFRTFGRVQDHCAATRR